LTIIVKDINLATQKKTKTDFPRYFTIGNITLDDIVLRDGTVRFGAFGGGAIYSAAAAKMWSSEPRSVGVISLIGPDYPQENILKLEGAGFDIDGIKRVDLPNIRVWLLYEENKKRQIVFHIDSGRSPELDPKSSEIIYKYLSASFVHVAPMAVSSQVDIMHRLHEKDIPFSLDLAIVGEEVNPKEILADDGLKYCRVFLPSLQEVQAIWGNQQVEKALKEIAKCGPRAVAIKMGDQGSFVFDAFSQKGFHVPAASVDVVDTTGAGDAFCGGFMVGYHLTGDALEAGLYGTVSASYAIQGYSAWDMLQADYSDVHQRLSQLRSKVSQII